MDNDLVNLKNVSMLIMDDFYRNRSARLSDEIKRVANETRVSVFPSVIFHPFCLDLLLLFLMIISIKFLLLRLVSFVLLLFVFVCCLFSLWLWYFISYHITLIQAYLYLYTTTRFILTLFANSSSLSFLIHISSFLVN